MIILGVDPGKLGGIAWWNGEEMTVKKMPATETDISVSLRFGCAFAYIEKVNAGPKMSSGAAFKFGWGYGGLRMALIVHGVPYEEVLPRTWMKHYGMMKSRGESQTEWKNRLKGKAQQLFPDLKVTLATADALLICEYGRRIRG